MSCIAAIGAGLTSYGDSAKKEESQNITIDGCENAFAKLTLEKIGVTSKSYILTDMRFKKGETIITDSVISSIRKKIETE